MVVTKYLRRHDMFGHKVSLNFNKDGDSHKTGCGGFLSILIKITLTLYLCLRLKALVGRENNIYTKSDPPTKFEELGEVSFEQTKIVTFIQVKSTTTGKNIDFPLESYQRYMKIYVQNVVPNPENKGQKKLINNDIRYCDIKDFKGQEDMYKIFTRGGAIKKGLFCLSNTDILKMKYSNFYKSKESSFVGLHMEECSGENCEKNVKKIDEFFKSFYLVFNIIDHNVDFTKYGEAPVKSDLKYIQAYQLEREKLTGGKIPVRRNVISTEDDYFQIGQPAIEHQYFDTNTFQKFTIAPDRSVNKLYLRIRFIFQLKQIEHSRQCYSFLDLFGDFGGFMEVLFLTSEVIVGGISEHMFLVKAIQKLYLAKSKHPDLFQKPTKAKKLKKKHKQSKMVSKMSKEEQQFISQNHVIKISFNQSMKLLIQSCIPCFKFDYAQKRLWRLYQEKIQTEFNLLKIIKSLRNLKIYIQNTSMDPETKIKVQNSGKNVINIDTDYESVDSSEPEEKMQNEKEEDVSFAKIHEQQNSELQDQTLDEFAENTITKKHKKNKSQIEMLEKNTKYHRRQQT